MDLFLNDTADSEMRIQAYLQVISCASSDVIDHVRNQLEREMAQSVSMISLEFRKIHDPLFLWDHQKEIR